MPLPAAITVDLPWPWSLPGYGLPALVGVALALVVLTLWTYLGVRGATFRRVLCVLVLRLLALLVAFLVVMRPSFAFQEDDASLPSKLFILLDYSESMKITDEFRPDLSRWDNARRILNAPPVAALLNKFGEDKVEIVYYQGAEDLRRFDPDGQPIGKRTDIGTWLHEFSLRHGREPNLRALLLFSDGADNGTKFPALDKAAQLRGVCPLFTFGLGKPTTTKEQNDIDVADIRVEPDPVPVKGKMTVKVWINAPGFDGFPVDLGLYIQEMGTKAPRLAAPIKRGEMLKKTTRNEVVLTCDAPDMAGEIKVTVKVGAYKPDPPRFEPLLGEVSGLNNEITTFASVTKEGVSILWVEGRKRAFEPVFAMRHALAGDQRFRVYFTERLPEAAPAAEQLDWFNFDKRHYDVIVIGDIPAQRFAGGDPGVFNKIKKMVADKGTGLVMLGGYDTLGGDWTTAGAKLAAILPVELPREPSQIEGKVRMHPTKPGEEYLLRLSENPDDNTRIWQNLFEPLDGISRVGAVKPTATLLAKGDNDEPILVGGNFGNGRVLVFAGDTTWKVWRRPPKGGPAGGPDTLGAYNRFWKQMMLYLARQENLDSSVQITLDKRRLPAEPNQRLGFTLRVLGKNGQPVKDPQFTVKVAAPNKAESEVPVTPEGGDYRGFYWMPDVPGEFKLEAMVKGKDAEGNELSPKPGIAHFLGHAQDYEMLRPAADHDFLAKLAAAGGGRFQIADERKLAQLLDELQSQGRAADRPKLQHWPDWRRNPASDTLADQLDALWQSTALPCFLAFVLLLCTEWFLRRRWGLV